MASSELVLYLSPSEVTELIKRFPDEKQYVTVILIDLMKAFDTFNHEYILLDKLKCYGIRGNANKFLGHIWQIDVNVRWLMVTNLILVMWIVEYHRDQFETFVIFVVY